MNAYAISTADTSGLCTCHDCMCDGTCTDCIADTQVEQMLLDHGFDPDEVAYAPPVPANDPWAEVLAS